jgi:hypothetical protein
VPVYIWMKAQSNVPVYIWMKAQRKEYGESPVIPIDYPEGSPYAVAAVAAVAAGPGPGPGPGPGAGNGNGRSGEAPDASGQQLQGHGVAS